MLSSAWTKIYVIGRHPASVRRRPSSLTFSNDFSSEAARPNFFHI